MIYGILLSLALLYSLCAITLMYWFVDVVIHEMKTDTDTKKESFWVLVGVGIVIFILGLIWPVFMYYNWRDIKEELFEKKQS